MQADREYAIQLAMEYGFTGGFDAQGNLTFDAEFVEAILEAIAKEREQIIAITETQEFSRMYGEFTPSAYDLVKAIRARALADGGEA